MLNKGNCFRDQVLNICQNRKNSNLSNPINFESGNFETLKNMVLKGNGYTLLPHMAVDQLSPSHKKLTRSFYKPIPTREVSLVYSKNIVKEKILNALEEEILASIPEELRHFKKREQLIVEIN